MAKKPKFSTDFPFGANLLKPAGTARARRGHGRTLRGSTGGGKRKPKGGGS